jgi:hypothetical protein
MARYRTYAKSCSQLNGCHLIRRVIVAKQILLVDDSELIRLAIRHFLESQRLCGLWRSCRRN